MINRFRFMRRTRLWRTVVLLCAVVVATSCTPYASVSIGVPFNTGSFYVNPSIGIGGFL